MNRIVALAQELTAADKNLDKLRAFKSSVLWWLRELVTVLKLDRGTYDIRYQDDQGTLQTEQYIVDVDLKTVLLPEQGVRYRICKSRTDYVGRGPQWFSPLKNRIVAFPSVLESLTQGVECAPDMLRGEKVLQGS